MTTPNNATLHHYAAAVIARQITDFYDTDAPHADMLDTVHTHCVLLTDAMRKARLIRAGEVSRNYRDALAALSDARCADDNAERVEPYREFLTLLDRVAVYLLASA